MQNSVGGSAAPFFMFGDDVQVDFATGYGIHISAGGNHQFTNRLYLHGDSTSTGSGIYLGASVTAGSCIFGGGKVSNWSRYGVETAVTMYGGDFAFSDNDLGQISGTVRRQTGHPPPVIDTLMAATALEHDLYLVTRNVRDVRHSGAAVFNPWEDDPNSAPLLPRPRRRRQLQV